MYENGHPQVVGPIKHVAQKHSEQKTGYKSEKLKMDSAEDKSRCNYGYMNIAEPFGKQVLQNAPEEQFFANGRQQGYHHHVDDETGGGRSAQKGVGDVVILSFGSSHPLLDARKGFGEGHAGIDVGDPVEERQADNDDRYGQK